MASCLLNKPLNQSVMSIGVHGVAQGNGTVLNDFPRSADMKKILSILILLAISNAALAGDLRPQSTGETVSNIKALQAAKSCFVIAGVGRRSQYADIKVRCGGGELETVTNTTFANLEGELAQIIEAVSASGFKGSCSTQPEADSLLGVSYGRFVSMTCVFQR